MPGAVRARRRGRAYPEGRWPTEQDLSLNVAAHKVQAARSAEGTNARYLIARYASSTQATKAPRKRLCVRTEEARPPRRRRARNHHWPRLCLRRAARMWVRSQRDPEGARWRWSRLCIGAEAMVLGFFAGCCAAPVDV